MCEHAESIGAAGGCGWGRRAGNVILDGNGCPVPPPVPLSSPLDNPPPHTHKPSSPAPLSLFLSLVSSVGSVFTPPTLNPCLWRVVSVAEIENSVVLLRHPRLNSTAEPRPRRRTLTGTFSQFGNRRNRAFTLAYLQHLLIHVYVRITPPRWI